MLPLVIRNAGFNVDAIEKLQRILLPVFFSVNLVATAIISYEGYRHHNPFKIGGWLINYQGGLVRRGLLGELFFQLSNLSNMNPGVFVVLFQVACYSAFFFFSYLLLKRQRSLLPYSLLIFSPFIFTFQLNDIQGGFRKEIIYFAILAFMIYAANAYQDRTFKISFYILLLLYPVIIMTHEMLAVFLPYFLIAYVAITNLTRKEVITIIFLLLPSMLSFFIATNLPIERNQILSIGSSLENAGYAVQGGALFWLDKTAIYGLKQVVGCIRQDYYYCYPIVLLISAIAFAPILQYLKSIAQNRISLFLFFTTVLGSIPLFLVALDWGRFIYVHLVSVFLLSFLSDNPSFIRNGFPQKILSEDAYNGKKASVLMISFFAIYSLFWHIPHYGRPVIYPQSYGQINIVAYGNPFYKAIKFWREDVSAAGKVRSTPPLLKKDGERVEKP